MAEFSGHVFDLSSLQAAVVASMNPRQQITTRTQQVGFLQTEAGEVQKEELKVQGCYGLAAQVGAEERMARELCDVLWNVLATAHRMGVDLTLFMQELLESNSTRVWPGDPLTLPKSGTTVPG